MTTQKLKNNALVPLDTGVRHQYDRKELHQYDISSSLSFYGERSETGESIRKQCRMDIPG